MSFAYVPGSTVEVPEIPVKDAVRLPAQKTAVIVVDMQNDFVKPSGTLMVPAAADTIVNLQSLLQRARAAGVPVAYTQDTHLAGDREWSIWPEHCRQGTWGWQIIDELTPQPDELICQKSRYDGFYDTWLDHYLSRVWQVEHLVIVGTVASICVLHTAAAAGLRWFHVVVPADGVSALTEFDQALTLRQVSWLYVGDVARSVASIVFE
ncbi:MAG: cysteine hydrolase [Caldilineaceae bacterium]|nr:cysteine hydrolase [Caldilineaceae bacterium]